MKLGLYQNIAQPDTTVVVTAYITHRYVNGTMQPCAPEVAYRDIIQTNENPITYAMSAQEFLQKFQPE